MPGFATYDDIINSLSALGRGQILKWCKLSMTAEAAGVPNLMWRGLPGLIAAGAVPDTGVGTIPTSSTAGAIPFTNAAGGRTMHALWVAAGGVTASGFILTDILWFGSGLSGTVTTEQVINSTALTRNTGGIGNQIALICWTATGTTAVNVTVNYTNSAGVAARTTVSVALWTGGFGGGTLAPTANQMQIVPLQAGDLGVRSIEGLTLSASTLTAGDFGVCIFKPVVNTMLNYPANTSIVKDLVLQTPSLEQVNDNACLVPIWIPSGTTTGLAWMFLGISEN